MHNLAAAAALLEESEDFRVLRRFVPRDSYHDAAARGDDVAPLKTALFLDVETTGLDTETAKIIELALVPFEFDQYGRIYGVGAPVVWFNDPGEPISEHIHAITGITDADVRGQAIDVAALEQLLAGAAIIVAHNADHDRKVCERFHPGFASIAWACSYREIDWRGRFGCVDSKLVHLLEEICLEFYEAHRASDDCLVAVHVLATAFVDGRYASEMLIESARVPTTRIWASHAPYGVKDALKAKGYRWHDGERGHSKAWFIDVRDEPLSAAVQAELRWLHNLGAAPEAKKLTARDRYSIRADQ